MKSLLTFLTIILMAAGVISCGHTDCFSNKARFDKVRRQIVSKFGDGAYFTLIGITMAPDGNKIFVQSTKDPGSLQMEQWVKTGGEWNKAADISLSDEEDEVDLNPPDNYMFRIGKDVDWDKVWDVVQKSKQALLDEGHSGKNVIIKTVVISVPFGLEKSELLISVSVGPGSGGTDTTFNYDRDGNLKTRD